MAAKLATKLKRSVVTFVEDRLREPVLYYYVVSYIKDDQVGEKSRFRWLKDAKAFAVGYHQLMVQRHGVSVWTGIELGQRGDIMVWLTHQGEVAAWPYTATKRADEISGR